MKKVLEVSLWASYNFETYPILFVLHSYFEHYINKGVWDPISNQEICAHGMS
jgi:hypothetical protein